MSAVCGPSPRPPTGEMGRNRPHCIVSPCISPLSCNWRAPCLPTSYTFQQVQEHTDQIWKFQRHDLIEEYHGRPPAPPPFILLSHLHLFIKRVVLKIPAKRHKQLSKPSPPLPPEGVCPQLSRGLDVGLGGGGWLLLESRKLGENADGLGH